MSVSVGPILKGQELLAALKSDQLVWVGHLSSTGEDHTRVLGKFVKLRLLTLIEGRQIEI
jgi:hypothetical protein